MRRRLGTALAGIVVIAAAIAGAVASMHATAAQSNVGELEFANELRIHDGH